jgi:hAT family C-terminal dimerisation region
MQYPTIARIAKDYLAIQGLAVPSECAFSSSALTATARRNRLLSETFGQFQLLKSAYCEGHISAASKVELAVPRAHSPIILE